MFVQMISAIISGKRVNTICKCRNQGSSHAPPFAGTKVPRTLLLLQEPRFLARSSFNYVHLDSLLSYYYPIIILLLSYYRSFFTRFIKKIYKNKN